MKKKRQKTGLPPGSVIYTGNQKVEKVVIHYLQFDSEQISESKVDNHEKIAIQPPSEDHVDWYDIRGLHDTDLIELIGKTFSIHPLIMEDVADIYQRPKFDEYEQGNFISVRALQFDKESLKVRTEQVSIYFRNGLLVSFQENETDLFEAVRLRLKSGRGKIRQRGADYLAYALMDTLVDNYLLVLDDIEEIMESLEEELISDPSNSIKERLHYLKKELLIIRKSIAPLREAISKFSKSENAFIAETSIVFVRDLYDHTVQIMDMVETYRDMLNGLQDLYLSEISYRMNQVMQVLTLIATIFIPLTFLVGIYGMNFDYMPELHWKYGYFTLWSIMVTVAVVLVILFRRKRWL